MPNEINRFPVDSFVAPRLSEEERTQRCLPDDYDEKKETEDETWEPSRAITEAAKGKRIVYMIEGYPGYKYITFNGDTIEAIQDGEVGYNYSKKDEISESYKGNDVEKEAERMLALIKKEKDERENQKG
jgi:hypothetical protein